MLNIENIINNYILDLNNNEEEIIITFLNNKIENNNNLLFYQRYITENYLDNITTFLNKNNYTKSTNIILESKFEDKVKYHYNNINENSYYKQNILNFETVDNIIIYKQKQKIIEPTMFPNVVKYTKYEQISFNNDNINIILKKYNINNLNNKWFYEIIINNKNNSCIEINKIIEIVDYFKKLYIF
jgi:hypothetical protein